MEHFGELTGNGSTALTIVILSALKYPAFADLVASRQRYTDTNMDMGYCRMLYGNMYLKLGTGQSCIKLDTIQF